MTEARLFDDSKHLDLIYKLFGFDRIMTEKELLLVFRDEMTHDTVHDLLSIAEIKMNGDSGEKKLIRRVFNILVECVQNIANHADISPVKKLNKAAILVIGKGIDHYFVITGNLIRNERIENLKEIIDLINGLSPEVIRDYYTEKMRISEFSDKGGAGLGLLDMARRSGRKLEYDFRPVDEHFSYFSFKVNIAFELPGVEVHAEANKKG
ncbi:MAG: SiaB family protein kinase [Bacteroidia bacterium]